MQYSKEYSSFIEAAARNQAAKTIQQYFRKQPRSQKTDLLFNSIEDNGFNEKLIQCIAENRYDQINFQDPDFTPRLLNAFAKGIINNNQMLTAKLMYESLFWFSHGATNHTSSHFNRHDFDDDSLIVPEFSTDFKTQMRQSNSEQYDLILMAYLPEDIHQADSGIVYLSEESREYFVKGMSCKEHIPKEFDLDNLGGKLNDKDFKQRFLKFTTEKGHTRGQAMHYYSINLSEEQEHLFIHSLAKFFLNVGVVPSNDVLLYVVLYINRMKINNEDKKDLEAVAYQFGKGNAPQFPNVLIQLIELFHPCLTTTYNPENPLKLTLEQYNLERNNMLFFVAIFETRTAIPSIAIPSPAINDKSSPFCFVIPTMDTLNALQSFLQGDNVILPIATLGSFSPRMIRAYAEVPTKKEPLALTKAQQLLKQLYPASSRLSQSSRPVEITAPNVSKVSKPHGCDCCDFLITWHDVFHAVRSGANDNQMFQTLSVLHDDKAGLALQVTGMSKVLWALADRDFYSISAKSPRPTKEVFFEAMIEKLGIYNFSQPIDDNYLLLHSLYHGTQPWPDYLSNRAEKCPRLSAEIKKIALYLDNNQEASIVELIMHDLIQPTNEQDMHLLKELRNVPDLKKLFYWSKNDGLHFTPIVCKSLEIGKKVRATEPDKLREFLSSIPTLIMKASAQEIENFIRGPKENEHVFYTALLSKYNLFFADYHLDAVSKAGLLNQLQNSFGKKVSQLIESSHDTNFLDQIKNDVIACAFLSRPRSNMYFFNRPTDYKRLLAAKIDNVVNNLQPLNTEKKL